MTIYHKHHIIPKHAGGSDDPVNLIKLTVEEHAEAHRIQWELHGRWQDELAWKSLSSQIGTAEILREKSRCAALNQWTCDKHREKISNKMRETMTGRAPWNKGKTLPDDLKSRLSDAAKKRKRKPYKHSEKGKQNMREAAIRRWSKTV